MAMQMNLYPCLHTTPQVIQQPNGGKVRATLVTTHGDFGPLQKALQTETQRL